MSSRNSRRLGALVALALACVGFSAAPEPPPKPTWFFYAGEEYPGAKGSFVSGAPGSDVVGTLNFDFTGGGLYVGARQRIDVPEGFSELQIKVRSNESCSIGIRIIDGTGQVHQFSRIYDQIAEWQIISVNLLRFNPTQSWGGAKDRKLHFPIEGIHLVVGRDRKQPIETQKGAIDFGEVTPVP